MAFIFHVMTLEEQGTSSKCIKEIPLIYYTGLVKSSFFMWQRDIVRIRIFDVDCQSLGQIDFNFCVDNMRYLWGKV